MVHSFFRYSLSPIYQKIRRKGALGKSFRRLPIFALHGYSTGKEKLPSMVSTSSRSMP